VSTCRIAEVAERSGFAAPTLPHDETAGRLAVSDDCGIALEVHAPDAAADVVTALFGVPG
jgi:hypothetical protein